MRMSVKYLSHTDVVFKMAVHSIFHECLQKALDVLAERGFTRSLRRAEDIYSASVAWRRFIASSPNQVWEKPNFPASGSAHKECRLIFLSGVKFTERSPALKQKNITPNIAIRDTISTISAQT